MVRYYNLESKNMNSLFAAFLTLLFVVLITCNQGTTANNTSNSNRPGRTAIKTTKSEDFQSFTVTQQNESFIPKRSRLVRSSVDEKLDTIENGPDEEDSTLSKEHQTERGNNADLLPPHSIPHENTFLTEDEKNHDPTQEHTHYHNHSPDLPTPDNFENFNENKAEYLLPHSYDKLLIHKLDCSDEIVQIEYKNRSCGLNEVGIYINIRQVQQIDEIEDTITLDMDLHAEWVDGLLDSHNRRSNFKFFDPPLSLDSAFLDKIWKPDVFFDQVVQTKRSSILSKPLTIQLFGRGSIMVTTRLSVKLSCEMNYMYYPVDTQACLFTIRSYSYDNTEIDLLWLNEAIFLQDPTDPNFDVQISATDFGYVSEWFRQGECQDFKILGFTLLARRKLSYHMVQTYLPSVLFIIITWLCFLIPPKMVEARIGVSMTTLLTLISMFDSVREHAPTVSYVKAVDVWMVFCIFCVFTTLFEFTVLVWLNSKREDQEGKNKDDDDDKRGRNKSRSLDGSSSNFLSRTFSTFQLNRTDRTSDRYAFVAFFVGFVAFNIVYWSWLLHSSNYYGWELNPDFNKIPDDN